MKKFKSGVIAFIVLILMSGCVKSNTNMVINNDRSMNLNMDALISDQILQALNISVDDLLESDELKSAKKAGIEIKSKKENGYSGVDLSTKFNSIDDISTKEDVETELSSLFSSEEKANLKVFKVTEGFLKNIYKVKLKVDMGETEQPEITPDNTITTSEDNAIDSTVTPQTQSPAANTRGMDTVLDSIGGAEELTDLVTEMEITFAVKLPRKNLSTNAQNVSEDGKELSWKISAMNKSVTTMEFEFDMINKNNLYMLIGGIVLFLIIVIILIVVINKKKKKKIEQIPTDGPIHKDFDSSVANVVSNETQAESQVTEQTVVATEVPLTQTLEPSSPVSQTLDVQQPTIQQEIVQQPIIQQEIVQQPIIQQEPVIQQQVAAEPLVAPQTQVPPMQPVSAPTMQVEQTVAPQVNMETQIPVEPTIQAPAVAEMTMPTQAENLEFTLPDETASVNAQVVQTPENRSPMFVTLQPEETPQPSPQVQELVIEKPDAVDINDTQI